MFDELADYMDAAKRNDLLSRLELQDTDSALAAEAELSMLWAISRVAHLEVEPKSANSTRRPDALSADLFLSAPSFIEIRALSDDSFSGRQAMTRTANIVAGLAERFRKGAGTHLYFEFNEESYWANNRYHRERCVDPDFQLTQSVEQTLRQWITAPDWPNPDRIRITEGKTDVVIRWRKSVSPHFRVFCTMPPVAYDLEDNPIYKALKKKTRQIKHADSRTLRCIFLVDAGCNLLRRLRPMSAIWEIGGEKIIRHALNKLSIDIVCVFSPYRKDGFGLSSPSGLIWNVTCFDKKNGPPGNEYHRLRTVAGQLPRPRYEGYQARNLHRQDVFNPQSRGQYLGTSITTRPLGGKMTIRLSSRLVQEYFAGRIDATQFARYAFGNGKNFFEVELLRGHTIQAVRFESGGPDEDDDYLVFDLDFDWSANSLKDQAVSDRTGRRNLWAAIKRICSRFFRSRLHSSSRRL